MGGGVAEVAVAVVAQRGRPSQASANPANQLQPAAEGVQALALVGVAERRGRGLLLEGFLLVLDESLGLQPRPPAVACRVAGLGALPFGLQGALGSREVAVAGVQVVELELMPPAPRVELGVEARQHFVVLGLVVGVGGQVAGKGAGVVFRFRARPAQQRAQLPALAQPAAAGLPAELLVAVLLGAGAGHVDPVGSGRQRRQVVVAGLEPVSELDVRRSPSEGAAFEADGAAGSGGHRGQVDDPGQGVAAPDGALRAGQEFDGGTGERHEMGEVVLRAVGGVVHLHAVDEHQGVVRLRAAQARLGDPAEAPGLADGQVGKLAQGIHADRSFKARLDAGDRQNGIIRGQPMGSDDQGFDFIRSLRGGGSGEQEECEREARERGLATHGELHRSAHTRTDRTI